jgi:hypothetical protein
MDKEQEINTKFDHSTEVLLFSDIVEVNVTGETVTLSFATQSRDGKTAKVSHTVYLTVPHFIRLADVSHNVRNNIVNEITKRAEEFRKGNNSKK